MNRLPGILALASFSVVIGCSAFDAQNGKDPNVRTAGHDDTDTGGDRDTGEIDTGDSAEPPIDADHDGSFSSDDCDDADPNTFPGADELCDGKDNDCDGLSDGEGDNDGDTTLDCADYCPVYAAPGASGDGRIVDPVGTIQQAVDDASASGCNEVRAFQGTYYENINWNGTAVNAESVSGADYTIIDGGGSDSVVVFLSGEPEEARLFDFTITNGGGAEGAGLRIRDASPTIEYNIIQNNVITTSGGVGGGIRLYNASPAIMDNFIVENDACYGGPENGCDGGAIDIRGGTPWIVGNYMAGNTAGDGGAIWTAYSDGLIAQNIIVGNEVDDAAIADGLDDYKDGQGGGIDVQVGGPIGTIISGNIISDNRASTIGGGIVAYEYSSTNAGIVISNNVITYNNVLDTDWGAGFTQWGNTQPRVYNNIIYGNLGVGAYSAQGEGTFSFTYNDVFGNVDDFGGLMASGGTGNVSVDPKFTSASNDADYTDDDFTLGSGSPMIDAGDATVNDTDGSRSDMGAYGGPYGM